MWRRIDACSGVGEMRATINAASGRDLKGKSERGRRHEDEWAGVRKDWGVREVIEGTQGAARGAVLSWRCRFPLNSNTVC